MSVAPAVSTPAPRAGLPARVDAVVAGGRRVDDAGRDRAGHRVIERWVGRTAEAHVGDRGFTRARGHPVDRGNGVGHRRVALAVQHADRHQGRVLGHAVGRTTEQPGDEGAVPVAVLAVQAVTHEVDAGRRPADEVDVGGADPGVDDVRVHRGSSPRRREPVVEWEVRLVEAIQRPRRGGLRARDR